MQLTNTQKEYLFENGWRGQIETHSKGIDITIFNEGSGVILTENIEYIKELKKVLGELLIEAQPTPEKISNCCGAPQKGESILCSDCLEPCEFIEKEN